MAQFKCPANTCAGSKIPANHIEFSPCTALRPVAKWLSPINDLQLGGLMTNFAPALATVIFVYIYYVLLLKQTVDQKKFLLSLALAVLVVSVIGWWVNL
jgi:hypothetical protein